MKDPCKTNYHSPIFGNDIQLHPDLLSSMSYCLVKSGQILRSRMDEIMAEHQLLTPHLGLLIILSNSQLINQLKLGETIGIDKATMVKLIDDLEICGFVTREIDHKDRRAKLISITKNGQKFTTKMVKIRIEIENEFLAPFNKVERDTIRKILPLILNSFYATSRKYLSSTKV